jgi:hypothetical protein
MRKEAPCLLWTSAQKKAEEKHLQMENVCPVNEICDGTNCLIINGPKGTIFKAEEAEKNELPTL